MVKCDYHGAPGMASPEECSPDEPQEYVYPTSFTSRPEMMDMGRTTMHLCNRAWAKWNELVQSFGLRCDLAERGDGECSGEVKTYDWPSDFDLDPLGDAHRVQTLCSAHFEGVYAAARVLKGPRAAA